MWDPPTPPKNPKKGQNWGGGGAAGGARRAQPNLNKAKSGPNAQNRPGLHSKQSSVASGAAAAQGSKPSAKGPAAGRNYDKPWL